MKKNISINISGIIFHIEEDGYDTLKKYLDSISRYFSSFEDSAEILADIETRIAEILLSKLNEGKQVITLADVTALMTTMGSVSDFKAAEEHEPRSTYQEQPKSDEPPLAEPERPKTLHRDIKRKILGGVCAGLGHHFNIDPVWIRLLFFFLTAAYGITLIVYIVMWIIVPGSYDLEEPRIKKKMFRDRDHKVLSGVAAGVAAYFGVDRVLVRVLFVVFAVFGGLVIYIVLTIVLPQAVTLTDKMQMQGEPVTISNIAANINKNLGNADGQESVLVKILLFPFRVLAAIFTALGKILGPVAEVLRVAIGILVSIVGLAMVTGLIVAVIAALTYQNEFQVPFSLIRQVAPTYAVVAALIAAALPGIIILLLGLSIITQRIVFSASVGWGLFVAFVVCSLIVGFTIPKIVLEFQEDGTYAETQNFDLGNKTAVLKMKDIGYERYSGATLTLQGYDGNTFKLEKDFEAQGSSRMDAAENAKMVSYQVTQQDSILMFDSNITFPDNAKFRAQRVDMTLFIPKNHPFVLDNDIWRLVNYYIPEDRRKGQTWEFQGTEMKCTTCPVDTTSDNAGVSNTLGYSGFDQLEFNGMFNVDIQQGDTYGFEIKGDGKAKRNYEVTQNGSTLSISYNDHDHFWDNEIFHDDVHIYITMPHLKEIEVRGAGNVNFHGFDEPSMRIEGTGAVKLDGDLNAQELDIDITGATELQLRGHGHSMDASVQGASQLHAYDYHTENAYVKAGGASHADVYVTDTIEMEQGIASGISYRGNPQKVSKD